MRLNDSFPRARPSHSVTIGRSFEVGSYEITNRQFKAYLDDDTDATQGACSSISSDNIALSCATWAQAKAYVVWLSRKTNQNYRLLSESEWEYAARAGTTTAYSTGDSISDSNANIDMLDPRLSAWGGTNASIQSVGRYSPNAWGLYDVHGNAAEWVQDCWHDSYTGAPTDGSAWEQNCTANTGVSRGGAAADGVIIYQRNRRGLGSQTTPKQKSRCPFSSQFMASQNQLWAKWIPYCPRPPLTHYPHTTRT